MQLQKIKQAILLFIASLLFFGIASAAEIQVITSGAFAQALKDLVPEYEKQSPNTVMISYGSSMGGRQTRFHRD